MVKAVVLSYGWRILFLSIDAAIIVLAMLIVAAGFGYQIVFMGV